MNENDTETVWCTLTSKSSPILLGVCYNSTSATAEQKFVLYDKIRKACDEYKNVMVCGDFNHPSID